VKLVLWIQLFSVAGEPDSPAARQQAALEAQKRSLDVQRTSVRKQAHLEPTEARFFVTLDDPLPQPSGTADCDALSPMRVRTLVDRESKRAGIEPDLLEAVMRQESAFRPCAVSAKGAQGLMQLMPATAEQFGVTDALDPDKNVAAGATLLKQLLDRYAGDLNRTLGAYNAGPSRVDSAGGVPQIPETMRYVESILGKLNAR
jgi:soluble lytic murein transglycosylase-like protein